MKNARYIVATLMAIITMAVLCPDQLAHTRVWSGHCVTATWNLRYGETLRIVAMHNRYYTGVGVYLPESNRLWCDYAIAFNGDSIYTQYPNGPTCGVTSLIEF